MRITIAALTAAFSALALAAPGVEAAPVEVNVRIEGKSETLFEGPILTEGHSVRAFSDAGPHRCDGVNNGKYPTPGPTPTAASADAMGIAGEGFDGEWFPGYDDYFITRWGPDGQDVVASEYWGVLVNNVFTSVGGCQYQLDGGDEVLWTYDAFKERPLLALFPAGYAGGARPLTAIAEPGEPFEVEVDAYEDDTEVAPPAAPKRAGASPFTGAEVAPVKASAKGFEWVDAADPATAVTDDDGLASISFDTPGWHRIKATRIGPGGKEDVVRSNRLDVCVPAPPATGCGPPPDDDLARVPPPPDLGGPGPDLGGGGSQGAAGQRQVPAAAVAGTPTAALGQVRLQLPRIDRSRLARGLVKLTWRVLDPGVGLERWAISSKRLGRKGAASVIRAKGAGGTSATLRLPGGATYQLQIVVVDILGRSSTAVVGRVQVPG